MARLHVMELSHAQTVMDDLRDALERRLSVSSIVPCPVEFTAALVRLCATQSCGKCTPCRIGLSALSNLLEDVLENKATEYTLDLLERTAKTTYLSSDCAIGYEAGEMVLTALSGFRDDFEQHVKTHSCGYDVQGEVPCVRGCPAHVDIPAYISLVEEGRYTDAIKVIRKDNPLPLVCGLVCEHPCEMHCRRAMVDNPLNILALKRFAAEHMEETYAPECSPATGKKVAVIGGGPAGLSCAYYLATMGHSVKIFEARKHLGGMLRYGIPNYRFPKDRLDEDINAILGAGDVEVVYNTNVGKDIPIAKVQKEHDAMFVAIGAQVGKTLRMPGADAQNVFSAVEMLDDIGNGHMPDYSGKTVIVIGGGNVAMDAARSAVRCGAKEVSCVYRRRQKDMTALNTEIESAIMEGVVLGTLQSPVEITKHKDGTCSGLTTQPQKISTYRGGRPGVVDAAKPTQHFDADVILIAVGQDIVSAPFEEFGMKAEHNIFVAGLDTEVENMPGIYVGGDCATGPSTVIRAIAAGKVAAHNIDEYLGYHHKLHCEAVSPEPKENIRTLIGRTEIGERPAFERKKDFECVEEEMTYEEAMQECSRCLRCDHFGCGAMEGGTDI